MPPYVARKRSRSASPSRYDQPSPKRKAVATPKAKPQTRKKKPTLFEEVDSSKVESDHSLAETQAFLANISDDDDDDDDDELSDVDSDDFEDVEIKKPKVAKKGKGKAVKPSQATDDDEAMDWEEAFTPGDTSTAEPSISGNLELTLNALPSNPRERTLKNGKKGPSKMERFVRNSAHCMHVQFLLFHNHVRNVWANDKEVQKRVVACLTPAMKKEIERWKTACGDMLGEDKEAEVKKEEKSKKGKEKIVTVKAQRDQRDWGEKADHAAKGDPNISRGDPTMRLLKTLCAFWRKRFTITAPAIRKQGYKDMRRLEAEIKAHRETPGDEESFGERIAGLKEFRDLARLCEGSRDVGAQLFAALLRASGLETRLVASLQPVGFGFSKNEDAKPPKENDPQRDQDDDSEDDEVEEEVLPTKPKASTPPKQKAQKKALEPVSPKKKAKSKGKGAQAQPIKLEDDTSEMSDPPESDNDSVVDITPASRAKKNKRYDRDLPFPTYWVEVLSPISKTWIPVDPIVLNAVANNTDILALFEPRGSKADKAKQVMAYVVAYSADLTAKDVTVRYLKKHVWPGKTKGVRLAAEKVPLYNKRGKIVEYVDRDFFPEVLSPYIRHPAKHTKADHLEDTTDLKPVHPTRDTTKAANEESLQYYKSSAEFVLARHLRREEALLPTAKSVKTFTSGKDAKETTEEVFLRKDVVACKTAESWHKEGRSVIAAQIPHAMKQVPVRAVTLIRKREIEEVERETGEKMKQPLYARHQTEWIIPPPIVEGRIPKNAFGNMDVYVPTMVPRGATHVKHRGTAKLCKKLGIDFAEACTGFEFGNKRAVPVLTGVVVAEHHRDLLIDAWRADQAEKEKKEKEKREKLAMLWWRKMHKGLMLVERMRRDYGDSADVESHITEEMKKKGGKDAAAAKPAAAKGGKKATEAIDLTSEPEDSLVMQGEVGGGFMAQEEEEDELNSHIEDDIHGSGGFVLEDDSPVLPGRPLITTNGIAKKPRSLMSLHANDAEDDEEDADDDTNMTVDDETGTTKPKTVTKKARAPRKARAKKEDGTLKTKITKTGSRAAPTRESSKVKSPYFVGDEDEDDE